MADIFVQQPSQVGGTAGDILKSLRQQYNIETPLKPATQTLSKITTPVTQAFSKITSPVNKIVSTLFNKKPASTSTSAPISPPISLISPTKEIAKSTTAAMLAYDPTKAKLVPGAGPGGLTGSYTGITPTTPIDTPAVELLKRTQIIKVTAPHINQYTTKIPVLTEYQVPTEGQTGREFVQSLPKAEVPTQFKLTPSPDLFVPGYLTSKNVNIGYVPTPTRPYSTIYGKPIEETSFAERWVYGATHPGEVIKTFKDVRTAAYNPIESNIQYIKDYYTGSKTPEFTERSRRATLVSGVGGAAKIIAAPITAAFKQGPYLTNVKDAMSGGVSQLWSGLPGVSQVKSAQVMRDIRNTDYQNRKEAIRLGNEAKSKIVNLVNYKLKHPELDSNVVQNIESHNQAVSAQNKVVDAYKAEQELYSADLKTYENTLQELVKAGQATYNGATKNYEIKDVGGLVTLKTLEAGLDNRAAVLNKQYNSIVATNDTLDKERADLEGPGKQYNTAVEEVNKLGGQVNYALSKFGERQQEMVTPYQLGMTGTLGQKVLYQTGEVLSGVGSTAIDTALLRELGVFKGATNVFGLGGRNLLTSGPALSTGSKLLLGGFAIPTVYGGAKEYSGLYKELYPESKIAPYIGAGVGGVKGLLQFGVATDIASEGQLSLFKGYQVRDIQGRLAGGGLNIRNPLSSKLSATKPVFSYGEVGPVGSGTWGAKLFGYARPNVAALELPITAAYPEGGLKVGELYKWGVGKYTPPTSLSQALFPWQGKEQSAFLLSSLSKTAPESAALIRTGAGLGEQAYVSGLKTTGQQYEINFDKLQSLKGLPSSQVEEARKIAQEMAEQTTGLRALFNAATSSGPKQFMGSTADEAKGLLAKNFVRAGKVGDLDIDFYGNAIGGGQTITSRLNAAGPAKFVFDENLGKVEWKSPTGLKTVFNTLGDDIPGAYLKYTPFGSLQKPSEIIGYKTADGTINVATKSTSGSFYDKLETGMGSYFQEGGTVKLVVAPNKIKSVDDLKSMVQVLSNRGFIASPDANAFSEVLNKQAVGVTIRPLIEQPTPTPFPISGLVTRGISGTSTYAGRMPIGMGTLATETSFSKSISTPSLLSSMASGISSTSAPSSVSSASAVFPSSASEVSGASSTSGSSRGSRASSASSASEASSASSASTGLGSILGISGLPLGWPDIGGLPTGGEAAPTRQFGVLAGVNVNFLRNFFFEKVQSERPSQMRGMLSTTSPESMTVGSLDVKKKLGDALGKSFYSGIVSNSTPFQKKLSKRKVKK